MKKMKNKNRFKIINEECFEIGIGCRIIEDIETGVNYLYHYDEHGGGLTVLFDEEGQPLIAPEK